MYFIFDDHSKKHTIIKAIDNEKVKNITIEVQKSSIFNAAEKNTECLSIIKSILTAQANKNYLITFHMFS